METFALSEENKDILALNGIISNYSKYSREPIRISSDLDNIAFTPKRIEQIRKKLRKTKFSACSKPMHIFLRRHCGKEFHEDWYTKGLENIVELFLEENSSVKVSIIDNGSKSVEFYKNFLKDERFTGEFEYKGKFFDFTKFLELHNLGYRTLYITNGNDSEDFLNKVFSVHCDIYPLDNLKISEDFELLQAEKDNIFSVIYNKRNKFFGWHCAMHTFTNSGDPDFVNHGSHSCEQVEGVVCRYFSLDEVLTKSDSGICNFSECSTIGDLYSEKYKD